MGTQKLKLGVIGAWGHFPQVLEETKSMPEVEIVGLAKGMVDEDFSSVQEKQQSTEHAPVYSDHRQLLAEEKPDVVTVSTRLDRITELAIDAANAGCHLICEKPLALSHEKLKKLWEAVTTNGVECLAMLNNRADPILAAAQKAVKEGEIGNVRLLNARKSYRFGNRPEWFGKREIYGGTIPWVGIHALDFIDAVTDSAFTSVAAMHANTSHPERPECEDVCTMTLGLANGALATASIDYLRPQAAPTHGDDWLRIVGDGGIIEAAMARGQCTLITHDQPQRELAQVTGQEYFAPFLRLLGTSGQGQPSPATRRSFTLTSTALHARDAADRGKVISIPEATGSS